MGSSPPTGWVAPPPATGPRRGVYVVGFLPLVLFVVLAIAAPGFLAPMFDTTVASGGASLGIVILLVAAALMLVGVAIMWRFPTILGVVVALVGFTSPSLFLIIMGPAVCLIVQNLST